ncbi:DNA-binding transcriptional regulator [Candidatus Sumerlaeota bacterium]|nr:DNA-binding transcriptional regulator [Candidatus Sumerlaeota bacterium]
MARKRMKRVAIDCPKISFFQNDLEQCFQGIFHYIREHQDWDVVLNEYWFSLNCRYCTYEELRQQSIDGIIFPGADQEKSEFVRKMGIPAVDYTGYADDQFFPSVQTDNRRIGQMAFEHFAERGFRNYAFFGPKDRGWSYERGMSFKEAVVKAGYHCFLNMPLIHTPFSHQGGWISSDDLFVWIRDLPKPVAIFVCHDPCAVDILHACQMSKIETPYEVAILGVNNTVSLCEAFRPGISSIDIDHELQGYRTAQLLDKLMRSPKYTELHQRIPPSYVVTRASTDILAVEDQAVAQAMQFIAEHFTEPISAPDAAKAAGISHSHLGRRFKSCVNHTIGAEIRRRRLKKAKELLLDTNMSLSEIAKRAGYCHANYFVNTFVKQEGISPAAWRKQRKD